MLRFKPKNAPKAFGGRASPGPAPPDPLGELTALPDLLAGLKRGQGQGNEEGERQEGIDS